MRASDSHARTPAINIWPQNFHCVISEACEPACVGVALARQIELQPGVRHGFVSPKRRCHNKPAAQVHLEQPIALCQRRLGQPSLYAGFLPALGYWRVAVTEEARKCMLQSRD